MLFISNIHTSVFSLFKGWLSDDIPIVTKLLLFYLCGTTKKIHFLVCNMTNEADFHYILMNIPKGLLCLLAVQTVIIWRHHDQALPATPLCTYIHKTCNRK